MSHSLFINEHTISIGYNNCGQGFFDLIKDYYCYIHSYFFSMRETMKGLELNSNDVFNTLKHCNTYGIPGNILFNGHDDFTNDWKYWIDRIKDDIELSAATVLSPEDGYAIKKRYRDMEIHLSIRYFDWGTMDNIIDRVKDMAGKIDVINISGGKSYNDMELIKACRDVGIKTKFIVNEGCITDQDRNYSHFPGFENQNCDGSPCGRTCDLVQKRYPWMALSRIDLYKESLRYFGYDILKVSSRSLKLEAIETLLNYWTSSSRTEYLYGIPIRDDNYPIFLEYIKERSTCPNDCWNCRKCKNIYNRLISC